MDRTLCQGTIYLLNLTLDVVNHDVGTSIRLFVERANIYGGSAVEECDANVVLTCFEVEFNFHDRFSVGWDRTPC